MLLLSRRDRLGLGDAGAVRVVRRLLRDRVRGARRRRAGPGPRPARRACSPGLGCLLLAVTPATVALSQSRLDAATRAFKDDDCSTAVDARSAASPLLRIRPEPFELLGYCDLRAGQNELAVRAMESARARDPHDWQYAYGLAVAQAFNGEDPRPMAALARRLNPQEALATRSRRRAAAQRPWAVAQGRCAREDPAAVTMLRRRRGSSAARSGRRSGGRGPGAARGSRRSR